MVSKTQIGFIADELNEFQRELELFFGYANEHSINDMVDNDGHANEHSQINDMVDNEDPNSNSGDTLVNIGDIFEIADINILTNKEIEIIDNDISLKNNEIDPNSYITTEIGGEIDNGPTIPINGVQTQLV